MNELVQWLRRQLDEDERAAHEQKRQIEQYQSLKPTDHVDSVVVLPFDEIGSPGDPDRVLCEVEAKRRIIWELDAQASRYRDGDLTVIISPEGRALADQARRYLRLLALPYADRAGYREEWRP